MIVSEPYITFSEDLAYGFVERTEQTATSEQGLAWLDARLTDEQRPPLPNLTAWTPARARVVGLEIWDEESGTRVQSSALGARVLWRVEISDALEVEELEDHDAGNLLKLLEALHEDSRFDGQDLGRVRLLHSAIEQADADRRARQAARPADAPRAYLGNGAGSLIARMFLPIVAVLDPGADNDCLGDLMNEMSDKLQAEDERQIEELRAELADFNLP